MGQKAPPVSDAETFKGLGCHVAHGLHLYDYFLSGVHGDRTGPHLEVAQPVVDGKVGVPVAARDGNEVAAQGPIEALPLNIAICNSTSRPSLFPVFKVQPESLGVNRPGSDNMREVGLLLAVKEPAQVIHSLAGLEGRWHGLAVVDLAKATVSYGEAKGVLVIGQISR